MPSMRAPGGWRVETITVIRDSRTFHLYRVTRHGRFVGEASTVDELEALGVPVDQLVEDED
jgi:hypothetical protein